MTEIQNAHQPGAIADSPDGENRARRLELELNELKSTMAVSRELLHNYNVQLNQSLEQMEKMNAELVRASRLKGQFLANTSHEFRTPLNSIIGSLQLITEGLCNDPKEKDLYVRNALDAAHQLLGVINLVLEITQIEANAEQLEVHDVDAQGVFEDLRQIWTATAAKKGLELIFEIPSPKIRIVTCDRDKLRRILNQLIDNAIKFTSQGHVKIALDAYPGEEHTRVISVEDTGIGIPEERHKSVFEKFVQGDGSSTRQYEGTGLGLTLAKRLVELMGGHIWIVKTGRSQGATISFTLPAGGTQVKPKKETADDEESLAELFSETF